MTLLSVSSASQENLGLANGEAGKLLASSSHPDSGTHSLEMETLTSTLYVKCPQSVGTLKKSCATAGPENSGEM